MTINSTAKIFAREGTSDAAIRLDRPIGAPDNRIP